MDDVLVFGKDQSEHDRRLTAVLEHIEAAGATLNPEKCKFGRFELKFLGHLVNGDGIHAAPDKTSAIREMAVLAVDYFFCYPEVVKLISTTYRVSSMH